MEHVALSEGAANRANDEDERKGGKRKKKTPHGSAKNLKFTISLSPKSAQALEELKELTDAATDSEAFRNALRLHLTLVRAHLDGKQLLVRDKKSGDTSSIPVTLFTAV